MHPWKQMKRLILSLWLVLANEYRHRTRRGRNRNVRPRVVPRLVSPPCNRGCDAVYGLVTNPVVRSVRHRGRNARLGGRIDSWYHWRTINWTAENYPYTMPYEVWTGFPTGNYVGQFGTLFDQLIVTVAMIVGLGDPSQQTLYTVSLLSIPVMAALVAIPVFYAGRRRHARRHRLRARTRTREGAVPLGRRRSASSTTTPARSCSWRSRSSR